MGIPLVEMGVGVALVVTIVAALVQRRRVYGGIRLSFDQRFVTERRRMSRSRWWDRQVRIGYAVGLKRAELRVRRAQSRYEEARDDAIIDATRRCQSGAGEVVGVYGRLTIREHEVAVGRSTVSLSGARASVAAHPKGWELRVGPEAGPFVAACFGVRSDAEDAAEAVNAQAYDHDRYRLDHPRVLHTAQVMAVEALDRSDLEWAEARLAVACDSGHLAIERVVARTERALARDAYIDALGRLAAADPEPIAVTAVHRRPATRRARWRRTHVIQSSSAR